MKKVMLGWFVLMIVCISPAWAGGPVVLMGIDAEDGGVGGHGPIGTYEAVVNSILGQVTNAGTNILVIGGGKNGADNVTSFWNAIDAAIPAHTVTYVNGAANIAIQSFAGFKMIAVVSDVVNTPSGGLTQAELDALNLRFADIKTHVNSGGGLLGFSQCDLANPYAYLGGFGTFSCAGGSDYNNINPTTEGTTIGVTDALDICCWHDTYTTFPSFLQVLATADIAGNPVAAIGGAEVVIPVPIISTVAAGLNFPFGVAVDNGDVYIADRNNHKVWKLSNETLTAVAGTGAAGYNGDGIAATTAQLDSPAGVAFANGSLFIADSGNHIIRKVVLATGIISTVAGTPTKNGSVGNGGLATNPACGAAPAAECPTLFGPRAVAVDAAGNIYIADTINQQIRKVAGGVITIVAGGVAGETGYVNGAVALSRLNNPLGVAVAADGKVYIADEGNDLIRMVDAFGVVHTVDAGALLSPSGVAVAADGTLYIADTDHHRIRRVSGPTITTVAGTGTAGFSGDGGAATAAQLSTPVAVAIDATGRFLYIADLINQKIRKVDFTPPVS